MFKQILSKQDFAATDEEVKEALAITTDDIKANNIFLHKRTDVYKVVDIIKSSILVLRRCEHNE